MISRSNWNGSVMQLRNMLAEITEKSDDIEKLFAAWKIRKSEECSLVLLLFYASRLSSFRINLFGE